jgi:hypothetical protein
MKSKKKRTNIANGFFANYKKDSDEPVRVQDEAAKSKADVLTGLDAES